MTVASWLALGTSYAPMTGQEWGLVYRTDELQTSSVAEVISRWLASSGVPVSQQTLWSRWRAVHLNGIIVVVKNGSGAVKACELAKCENNNSWRVVRAGGRWGLDWIEDQALERAGFIFQDDMLIVISDAAFQMLKNHPFHKVDASRDALGRYFREYTKWHWDELDQLADLVPAL